MIKLIIEQITLTLIYFIAHMLLLSHFKKKIDLPAAFKRSLLFLDTLTLIIWSLTILVIALKSWKMFFDVYANKKEWMLLSLLLIQTVYHVIIQLLFQKNVTLKSLSILVNSSIGACLITGIPLSITPLILQLLADRLRG